MLGSGIKSFGCSGIDRKSTRLNSSHVAISYAVFCCKKKKDGGILLRGAAVRREPDGVHLFHENSGAELGATYHPPVGRVVRCSGWKEARGFLGVQLR